MLYLGTELYKIFTNLNYILNSSNTPETIRSNGMHCGLDLLNQQSSWKENTQSKRMKHGEREWRKYRINLLIRWQHSKQWLSHKWNECRKKRTTKAVCKFNLVGAKGRIKIHANKQKPLTSKPHSFDLPFWLLNSLKQGDARRTLNFFAFHLSSIYECIKLMQI